MCLVGLSNIALEDVLRSFQRERAFYYSNVDVPFRVSKQTLKATGLVNHLYGD